MKRMIVKIKDVGMFVELLDNSKWAILPSDAEITCGWCPGQHVIISEAIQSRTYNHKIENIDKGQDVFALNIK